MAGIMPTSARPAFRSSAHCDGTANERSYLPARGPSVKPQTNGAVFRNSTMEMRSLSMFVRVRELSKYSIGASRCAQRESFDVRTGQHAGRADVFWGKDSKTGPFRFK